MSMLAEPKRKQKWSLNPRGKAWAQDTNKFGFKMLEKMGWSHGKGLGAKEDGMVEHIKVGYKNDSKGIGYKESDDQWTAHESNFSALLEALGGGEHEVDEIKLNSLEEKSQKSKARVHYKKFTRGKDLSKYSEKDLANIFGKKNLKELKKAKKQQEEKQEEVTQQIKEENNQEFEKSSFFSNGGLISDYFKKKLPNFGKTNGYVVGNNGVLKKADESESESEQRPSFGFGFKQEDLKVTTVDEKVNSTFVLNKGDSETKNNFIPYIYTNGTEETPEKKHKSKKKRSFDVDNDHLDNVEDTPTKKKKVEPSDVHQVTPIKKKKNKSKTKHDDQEAGLSNPAFDPLYTPVKVEKHVLEPIEESLNESLNETLNDTVGQVAETFEVQVQINNEGTPVKRNGEEKCDDSVKKKKKKKGITEDMNISYQNEEDLDQSTNVTKKKKKRKDTVNEELEEMDTSNRNVSKISQSSEDYFNLGVYSVDKTSKKKKDKNAEEMDTMNQSISKLGQLEEDYINDVSKKDRKKKKTKASSVESLDTASTNEVEITPKKKKSKTKQSQQGVDNPLFNISSESEESMVAQIYNPYELIPKEKKKKRKNKGEKENYALENPIFNEEDSLNSQDVASEEFEVKRKSKSKKKKDKKEEEKGIDNPALNLNNSIEESCDLMLNIIATPVISQEEKKSSLDKTFSIQKVANVNRRKSVRFSDVTRERIIPNKEESEQETLEDSSEVIEIEGKLNDSSELSYIDKFIQRKKAKRKNKGLDNTAFDKQANIIEENITSMSRTLDSYEAEIENDMNEAKLKTVELEDIMVGEVGNSEGPNEVLPDGTVKLKFKNAKFSKSAKYIDALSGAKKSYKHLIKGNIVMQFRHTNLHEVKGYAVKDS